MIVSKHPCPSKIRNPLNHDALVQCVDTDLVSNLEITPGINLKTLSYHQIPRSIISSLGENFQSTSRPNFSSLLVWVCLLIKLLLSKSLTRI